MFGSKKIGAILLGVLFLLVVITAFSASTTIPPGFRGLVFDRFGNGLEPVTLDQGWRFVAPYKTITLYPTSTETVYYSAGTHEGRKGNDSLSVGTKDGKTINIDVPFVYHFSQEKLPHIFTKFKGAPLDSIEFGYMKNELYLVINNVTSQYGIMDVMGNKRPEIVAKIKESLVANFAPDGIIVESVSISRADPDKETMAAIQGVVNAQNLLRQASVDNERAVIENKTKVAVAQAAADAEVIRAKGAAEANKNLILSLTPALVQWEWIKKWDGVLPKTSLGSSNGVMVNLQ